MESTCTTEVRELNINIVDNSAEKSAKEMCGVDRSAPEVMNKSRQIELRLRGDFDALRTVEQMTDLMQPAGYFERIILDFSDASRVNAVALYCLFAEMAGDARFNHIEICIEGLHFRYWIGKN
jgi:hypothetical protein